MDSRLKALIIEDYKKSLENLNQIVSGKKPNWFVLKSHQYLTPTIVCQETPLDDKWGEFYHYNQICETLERLLAGEKADYTGRFRDAPEEIVQLLNKKAA